MASYMQGYGVAEARRNRIIKFIILGIVSVAVLSLITYLIVHDYSEKQLVKKFLAEVNARDYQKAYATGIASAATLAKTTATRAS